MRDYDRALVGTTLLESALYLTECLSMGKFLGIHLVGLIGLNLLCIQDVYKRHHGIHCIELMSDEARTAVSTV